MKQEKNRRLASIMFTDIVGYTALMQRDEQAAAAMRSRHREVFQQCHDDYNGDILQYFGDGTLSVFQSGVDAVECAVAIQKALQEGEPVPLRIGLHMGDIVFDGTEIYGDGVNLASRIESMGVAGAILLSGKLNDELKNQSQISTRSLGTVRMKNVDQPIELFCVTNDGVKSPDRSELPVGKSIQGEPSPDQNSKKQTKTLAVLPFVNMSASQENEYFSDGITEEIINALSKIQNLKVTSRTSSFFFKNKNIPIRQIGQQLNVSTLLEGSIRLSGNRMRITAQLIDVADDFHFWSETFDRSVDDIFAVQDEISLLIADRLREHLGHFDIGTQLVAQPNVPVAAYKQYLRSRYHLLKMNKPDIEHGLSILEKIIEEQPRFAMAYLGVHLGYTLLGTIGLMPAHEAFVKGKPYLDKAIELDPDLPDCQLHLAWISFLQKWDLPSTYRHLNKALEKRPTVDYYQTMASTLVAEGKFDAALHYIETALQLDPFSSVNYHLKGFIFYTQERFAKALELFDKSIELKSSFMASTLYRGQTLLLMGKAQEGLAYFQNLPDDESEDVMKLGGTTLAHAALGNVEKATSGIAKLEAVRQTDLMERAMNLLILCQTMLGNEEAALNGIEQGVALRLPMMVYLYVEPLLKPLRSNKKFQELMRQVLGPATPFDFSERKYKKALFTKPQLEQHAGQLTQLMSEQRPFLNANLTLRHLAQMMGIPPNHLSQLLNEGFHKNFSEFINGYRLEAFKSKAADPANQHLTILALAYDSGFNSKTAFNTFFKKAMGITPSAYWRQLEK